MAKPDPYGTYEDELQAEEVMTQREQKRVPTPKPLQGQGKLEKPQLPKIKKKPNR